MPPPNVSYFEIILNEKAIHTRTCYIFNALDNPITVPRVDLGQAMIETVNPHFQYETKEKLDAQLQLEYDRVLYV